MPICWHCCYRCKRSVPVEIQILQLIEGAKQARGLTVIIYVLRAFTTEAFLMARNPEKLIAVGDVQTALDYRTAHPDTVLFGERGGANFLMESRAKAAAELYHASLLIATGGVKWDSIYGRLTEAQILKIDFGVPADKIILEKKSYHHPRELSV